MVYLIHVAGQDYLWYYFHGWFPVVVNLPVARFVVWPQTTKTTKILYRNNYPLKVDVHMRVQAYIILQCHTAGWLDYQAQQFIALEENY